MADFRNGLISSRTVSLTGASSSNCFVRVGKAGDVDIDGDLTVLGDIYASTIISTPDASNNPFYIINDNNLVVPTEFDELPTNALVVEAGADRIDISGFAVGVATFKPISQNLITQGNAEDVGSYSSYGIDTSGTTVCYGRIRVSCTDPTANATKGRIDFTIRSNTVNNTLMQIDASENAIKTQNSSRFKDSTGGTDRTIYPGAVKITTAGSITKETSATLVPESAFTIPTGLDGYYSFTAQVTLGGVGTVSDGENFQLYLDVSGGSLTPVNGTINIIDMTENSANSFSQTPGGIIMQRLTAGEVIQLYHLEQGSYTFSSGSIQVAYTYLGDTLLA
jgi:hypothetical protein